MNNLWIDRLFSLFGSGEGAAGLIAKLTLFLAIAWGFHVLFRFFNPRWRVQLWRFTALGSLILLGALCLKPLPRVAVPFQLPAVAPIPRVEAKTAATPAKRVERPAAKNAVTPAISVYAARVPVEPRVFPWKSALLVSWLIGVGLGLARLLVGLVRLHASLKKCDTVPDGVSASARLIEKRMGLRRPVALRKSSEVQSPVLIWWGKSVLVLPESLCSEEGRRQLPAVLGHEFAHVRSRDLFWNALSRMTALVLWFHPLVWRARRAHMEACELVADAEAATLLGDVGAYQGVVAEIALNAHAAGSLTGGLAFVWKSNVRQRLERLPITLRQSPVRRKWLGCMLVLAVAVVAVIAVGALEPRRDTFGIVRLPSGEAAPGARLYVVTKDHDLSIHDGVVNRFTGYQTVADVDGRVEFPTPDEYFKLVVINDTGAVTLTRKEWEEEAPLTIQPWGGIEGRMMIGGLPAVNETVYLNNLSITTYSAFPNLDIDWIRDVPVVTDAEGRFAFDRIAPGTYLCSRIDPETKGFVMPADAARVVPGKRMVVDLNKDGGTVAGRIDWSAMRDKPIRNEPFYMSEVLSWEDRYYPDHRLSQEEKTEAMDIYWQSNAGLAQMRKNLNRVTVDFDENGRFRAEHMKPGTYQLSVYAHPSPESGMDRNKQLGGAALVFEVPALGANGAEVDVGTVRVVPNRAERLGVDDPMPNLQFKLHGGVSAQLKDYLGAPMLVSFGGTFYNPDYFSEKIYELPGLRVVQLRTTQAGYPLPDVKVPADPRFTSGYVENGGMEAGYRLGMGGVTHREAYLINDKGTVLKVAKTVEELLPYLSGTATIDGEKNASPGRRFYVDTEFCIIKEEGGTAGNIMMMQAGRGMNAITVSNGINGKRYRMDARYAGSRGLKDLYDVEMTYPEGAETVSVEYEGKRIELFDDGIRKMLLRPKVKAE